MDARMRLFTRIKEGKITFSIPPSRLPSNVTPKGSLSSDTINLIRRLVCVHVDKRMTATQVLQEDWLKLS